MFPSSLLSFSLYLVAYYVVHSILTTNAVKQICQFKGYRIVYNLFAVLSLLPIIFRLIQTSGDIIHIQPLVRVPGVILVLLGVIIHIATFRWFSSAEFLGLKVKAEKDESIITDGIYSTCRHPFYLGTLLMFWGLFILFGNEYFLSFAAISTLYVFIGSRLEENKLIVDFKNEYLKYRQEVPMLLPWKDPLSFFGFLFSKQ